MWELDHKESWVLKNWCFLTVVLEKTLQSPLDSQEIQPVHPKGDQSWIFIGRTDAEAEAPVLWPPDGKNWLTGKDPDSGKDWRQEEKGTTEDEMIGWHHRWTWAWASSGSWWQTWKPGVLQSMGSQRIRHYLATEPQQQKSSAQALPGGEMILTWRAFPVFYFIWLSVTSCLSWHFGFKMIFHLLSCPSL